MALARPTLNALAVLFVAATALYSALWMYAVRREPAVRIGILMETDPSGSVVLRDVVPESPAQRAGLHAGDVLLALDETPLRDSMDVRTVVFYGRPERPIVLTVRRDGGFDPVRVRVVLDPAPSPDRPPLSQWMASQLIRLHPALFLAAVAAVLLLRVEDGNVWLLAGVFAGFIAGAPLFEEQMPPALRGFALSYKIALSGVSAALFLFLFSVFPGRSPVDVRAPWLKWVWLVAGAGVSLPLAAWAIVVGRSAPLVAWAHRITSDLTVPIVIYMFGGFGLGFASLIANALRADVPVRRKSRVIVWGTLVGFGPALALAAAAGATGREPYDFPFWVWAPCVMALSLLPLSYAYAVVKHRVLEVPVLLRRSARYLLVQRGSLGLLVVFGVAATVGFSNWFAPSVGPGREEVAIALGTAFGTLLVVTGGQVQRRLRGRIDRAFFRRAYDVRVVLQELADRARAATSREELAELIEQHVTDALHPSYVALYVEHDDATLRLLRGTVPPGWERVPLDTPVLAELARRPHPREVWAEGGEGQVLAALAPLQPECVVPIPGRRGHLVGLLVLGAPRSDDPYSGEDRRLLAAVASQAAIALESIGLAEQMAERIQAEARAAHEMELAGQVQSRLLPRDPTPLATLECAGRCVQTRAVGGDYYDFLDLGPGQLGLVLADISGKGFAAALLMAGLQASLRSHLGRAGADLRAQLCSVDRLLYRSSEANRYATLFVGVYDDTDRRLRYVNCGHLPPIVLRANGEAERLWPTAPVVGLLESWDCVVAETTLGPGDLLAVFSDGMCEAFSDDGEEFGEERLGDLLAANRGRPLGELIDVTIAAVRTFGGAEQTDDQTLVVARGLQA